MEEGWINRFSRVMERMVPDAITTSIVLLVLVFAVALATGNSLRTTMDAYYTGLWMLLPFTMQMTLIVVLSSILGSTGLFRGIISTLSRIPKTANQVIVVSVLLACSLSYFYWGLGIALGPIIAVHFARQAESKGIEIDFLFLLAVVMAAGSSWQYGLSASGPLLMATPGHFLETTTGIMPLTSTIWSPAAITHEAGFAGALTVAGCALMPRNRTPVSSFPEAYKLAEPADSSDDSKTASYAERLERSSLVTWVLCAALVAWLYYHFQVKRLGLDINSLNATFLFLCFLLHRNVHSFTKALQQAVASCWPVVVIYHLYAGVAGLIQHTTVGDSMAGIIASVSTPYTFPLLAATSATAVAVFVPSSGGQWVIQGLVTSKAAQAIGLTAQRGLLALGIGDQMGNLISPFWFSIVAGIVRVDFRRFYGYGLIFAALWFLLGVLVFTVVPC